MENWIVLAWLGFGEKCSEILLLPLSCETCQGIGGSGECGGVCTEVREGGLMITYLKYIPRNLSEREFRYQD
jgi:hypothetical protein